MRIATWNVNSINARLDNVLAWVGRFVAFQETPLRQVARELVSGLVRSNDAVIAAYLGTE